MLNTLLDHSAKSPSKLLFLGAHSDDIEIGCYAALEYLLRTIPGIEVLWVVFCADGVRGDEAARSAGHLLRNVSTKKIVLKKFRDGFLPYSGPAVKDFFEEMKPLFDPDVVFTHFREDLHQDHRLVSDLTWNTYRDHLIFEYEVPKYDGDIGSPNLFVPFGEETLNKKIGHLKERFGSQQAKKWFSAELFRSMARIRGMECSSPQDYAEAFYCRKMVLRGTGG